MAGLPERWKAADGTTLTMRRLVAGDAPLLKPALEQLSPASRRSRFFGEVPKFSDAQVRALVEFDPAKVFALLVVRQEAGVEQPVGGGRFVLNEDGQHAEISLLVGDAWQGQGIGRRLLAALTREASHRGIRELSGHVLAENREMLLLARSFGFEVGDSDEGPAVRRIVRELPSAPPRGPLWRWLSAWRK